MSRGSDLCVVDGKLFCVDVGVNVWRTQVLLSLTGAVCESSVTCHCD